MSRVIDASVATKWFFPEPGSTEAEALLGGEEPLLAPQLIVAEVCNVAWKRLRAGEITAEQATAAATEIGRMLDDVSALMPLAPRALEIAHALRHPVYDCFYLALADSVDSRVVTADDTLVRRVAGTPWATRVVPLMSRRPRR
ncbi:MAG: type II toxin-antitoxin system VapC family toxin [Candidatus Rokubacteria bacterium]|nr:type II toxin-antitoxin system VapC family toxin [Candidatus Rokubacteria bacterium]